MFITLTERVNFLSVGHSRIVPEEKNVLNHTKKDNLLLNQ